MDLVLKPRETRLSVMLPARMRDQDGWHDVRIMNMSSRGLMAKALRAPPPLGTYFELRRGQHIIVARVIWTNAYQFGAQTQDRIEPQSLIEVDRPLPISGGLATEGHVLHQRLPRRVDEAHERSRLKNRALEYAGVAAIALAMAALVAELTYRALDRSMAAIELSLSRDPSSR